MDDLFQLNTYLHFGAVVHISCLSSQTNFYFYSNGISFKNIIALAATDGPIQINQALFKITPVIKFDSEQFLQNILKQRYEYKNGVETNQKQAKVFIDQFQFELKQNNRFMEQQNRFPIKYYQNFMLQHIYSCKYLCYCKKQMSNEYSLQLCEIPNRSCVFNLQACFNYQKDINTYIPFDSAVYLNIKIYEGLEVKEMFLTFKKLSIFDSWQTSEEDKSIIKIGMYQNAEQIDYKNICYGDTIWIFHLQSGSFVKMIEHNKSYENFILNQIKYMLGYIKENYEMDQNENSAEIFLQKTQNQTSAEKFGLWQIVYASKGQDNINTKEHFDRFKGGKVKFEQQVRFFNVRYQSYLSVRKLKIGRNKYKFELATQNKQQNNTTFRIKSLQENSLYATTEDLFLIQHELTKTYLTLGRQFKIIDRTAPLIPSEQYKKEDNFRFTKIDFIQQWQNNYLLSIFPYIRQGVEVFKKSPNAMITSKQKVIVKLLLQNLIQMLTFSYDLTQGFQASQNKLGKMTYNHFMIQKLMRQQSIISELILLLKCINPNLIVLTGQSLAEQLKKESLMMIGTSNVIKSFTPEIQGENKLEHIENQLLKKIVNVTLKILRNCCKSNTQNSLVLFSQIQVFIPYLSRNNYAEQFFIDSFSNSIVLDKITVTQLKQIIDQYIQIQRLQKKRNPEIFKLLTNFLKFNEESISKNQIEIYNIFFQQYNPLVFQIQNHQSKLYIVHGQKSFQFIQFTHQFPQQTIILAAQIKFYANLTFDRNYVCSKQIKKILPLQCILRYLKQDINDPIKEGLIYVISHTYLNQKPRFKDKKHLIYCFYNIQTKQDFLDSLNLAKNRMKQNNDTYQYEMQEMKNFGISSQNVENILSCIQKINFVTNQEIQSIKNWLQEEINQSIKAKDIEFYSVKMQACLMCLKLMLQLSLFTSNESNQIQKMIYSVVRRIGQSLKMSGQVNIVLESKNFKQLLLQMVKKNVIKKSDFSAKFDGIQDQVGATNICSIYVNYAFYQNILLLNKNSTRRLKGAQNVSERVLDLIQNYNLIIVEQKMHEFLGCIIQNESLYKNSVDKKILIEKLVIQKTLIDNSQFRSNMLNLLITMFYNSNIYRINLFTIKLINEQLFAEEQFIQNLGKAVFIIEKSEKQTYLQLLSCYKEIKLLIQTSQIWLNYNFQQSNYQYDSILMYFITKLKDVLKLTVPNFYDTYDHSLYNAVTGNEHLIKVQHQIIMSNLDLDEQIISFLNSYKHFMIKITNINENNALLSKLFQSCLLFLYIFIYGCNENKNKIRQSMEGQTVFEYFSKLCVIDLGQVRFLVEYMKNNYQECIDYYEIKPNTQIKPMKYTQIDSRLQLTLLKFYNEPIKINLKKIFINVFDYTSFKNFIWLNQKLELQLDLNHFNQLNQPIFYHINAIQSLIFLVDNLQQSRNTIKSHFKKTFSQNYLYNLMSQDDYFSLQNSIKSILKLRIIFKSKLLLIIELVYLQQSGNNLIQLLQYYYQTLNVFIKQANTRKQTQDFRKIINVRDITRDTPIDRVINQCYDMNYKKVNLLEVFLQSIEKFTKATLKYQILSQNHDICNAILAQINMLNSILHRNNQQKLITQYPIPNEHNFSLRITRENPAYQRKKYIMSLILETQFNEKVYKKIVENQKSMAKCIGKILEDINLKQFLFLRKISEFLEDAFEKLVNDTNFDLYNTLRNLVKMLKLMIEIIPQSKQWQFRNKIGKSELIFPILNYFESCKFNKINRVLFLQCLKFFNQLIGQDGNKSIQTMFNRYFTNKSDSIDFFMKINQILNQINFQDRAAYKCKKLYDGIQTYKQNISRNQQSQFTLLNFLIGLCKGNFRDNQIFLSSLSSTSNFNIMSGIWQILKYQSQKYQLHLVNVQNYHLITQCFSTIRQLVEGPCVENQNQFLKRQFFITIMSYFEFQNSLEECKLQTTLQNRLEQIKQVSLKISDQVEEYLNQDKITKSWMPSQVKYRCINLIASLMSENVNENSSNQLSTISRKLIIRQIDKVYERLVGLNLLFTQQNFEINQETQIILPLGFKLFQVLQYYPKHIISQESPGLLYFKQNSRIIQVVHHTLNLVIFPKPTVEISDAFKNQFIEKVDRTSVNSKLRDLQNSEIQNRQSDFPYGFILYFSVFGLIICDFILYTAESIQYVKNFAFFSIFQGYGIISSLQICKSLFISLCTIFSLIFFFLEIRGANYMRVTISKIIESNKSKFLKLKDILIIISHNLSYLHYFNTFILSILGIFNPAFDGFLLVLELFKRNQTFYITLRAIKETLDQLLIIVLITFIMTYILTSVLYYYFAKTSYPDQCATLYYCFVFSLDNGFKADAGIVGYNDGDQILTDFLKVSFWDVLINFIYLFIIKVIIDQIIGAIIVDKFAQIRQEKQKLQQDQNSVCFICGIERNILDRQEDGFNKHKEQYHNIWSYMQFLIHIRTSKLSNLSGIQRYVYEEWKNGKLNWFPINRSYHLQKKKEISEETEVKEDDFEKLTKMLDTEIKFIKTNMDQMQQLVSIKMIAKNKMKKQ